MSSGNETGAGQGAHLQTQLHDGILAHVYAAIKQRVTAGETVAPSDFAEHERPAFWAAIPQLRDELPNLKPGWKTVRELHLAGIRVRMRTFRLRGAV